MDIEQFKEDLERQFRITVRTIFEKIPSNYKHMVFVAVFMVTALLLHSAIQASSSPFELIFLYIPIIAILGVLLGSSVVLLIWLGERLDIWNVPAPDEPRPPLKWLKILIIVLVVFVILALIGAYF